jgi:hypothetical protein
MPFAHPVVIGAIVVFVAVLTLSFVPYPNAYNVTVSVNSSEVAVVFGEVFSINSVSGVTNGQATVIDWGAAGLGFAWASLSGTFTMTVCVAGHCSSESAQSWFPSLPVLGGASASATNSFSIGYVPGGQSQISVTLTENGNVVATGSGSMCVGC